MQDAGTRAYARCCNFADSNSQFNLDLYHFDGSCNVGQRTQEMVGCIGQALAEDGAPGTEYYAGSFVGNADDVGNATKSFNIENTCTAQAGSDGRSPTATAICYDNSFDDGSQLNCVSVWGDQSVIGGA